MIESLFDRLKRHEGFSQFPKPDHQFKGNAYVIGYGCDITAEEAQTTYAGGITEQDAIALLNDKLNEIEERLFDACPWMLETLDEVRQGVFAEMAFQMGVQGLLGFHNTLSYAKAGNYEAAAHEMRNSVWDKQTHARAEELADLMLTGGGAPAGCLA